MKARAHPATPTAPMSSAAITRSRCGGETCDDGNGNNNDACPDGSGGSCLIATCGDGFTRSGVEECDDGNTNNTDSCVANCETAECGDGYTWNTDGGSEQCDDGQESAACNATCTTASCGDGVLNTTAGEACDAGGGSAGNGQLISACTSGTVAAGGCQSRVCSGDHYITYPGEVEECWRIGGDVYVQSQSYDYTYRIGPIVGGTTTIEPVTTLSLDNVAKITGTLHVQPFYEREITSCLNGIPFFGDNYVLHNAMSQITFPDLERVTGDVFIGKYEFCLIDGTCSDQQYNDNLDTLTFGEDIVIEQDLEVKENAQLPRVSFQRTVSVGGSVSQNSNGSNFCFQSANNAIDPQCDD